MLEFSQFVDCKVNSFKLVVIVKPLERFDLVLLKVKFLQLCQSFKTLQILDEIGLTSDNSKLGQILKALE